MSFIDEMNKGFAMSKIIFENNRLCPALYGDREINLRVLEEILNLSINARGNEVEFIGDEARIEIATRILQQLYKTVKRGFSIFPDDVRRGAKGMLRNREVDLSRIFTDTLLVTHRNKNITPRGYNQKVYVDAIRRHDLVFGIGPAGTGKTYLAMAMAVSSLLKKEVERIVLTRPAVEAGERLGFLPGTLQDKVDPYLRPLYDALNDMLGHERVEELMSRGTIEVAPLAFMRGRTLNNSFIILDEAQNTSKEQMKMFLTRLGFDSKAVVTGDITQIDLPSRYRSGLLASQSILKDVVGVKFCTFDENDVVRHPLVQRIIRAYNLAEEQERERAGEKEYQGEEGER